MDMIEKDRLVNGYPSKDWKDRIKNGFGLKSIAMVSNDGEEEDQDNKNKKGESLFHIHYLYGKGLKSVKKKSL